MEQTAAKSPVKLFSLAGLIMSEAFERLQLNVLPEDARDFRYTTLNDVLTAVRDVERQLSEQQCLRNFRRLQPLLDGLERYSKVVEAFCKGTPYLPLIWVRSLRHAHLHCTISLTVTFRLQ